MPPVVSNAHPLVADAVRLGTVRHALLAHTYSLIYPHRQHNVWEYAQMVHIYRRHLKYAKLVHRHAVLVQYDPATVHHVHLRVCYRTANV